MNRINIVVLIFSLFLSLTLSLSSQNAHSQAALLVSRATPAFAFPAKDYVLAKDSLIEINNLPVLHPQDGLPTCCSHAAVTLWTQTACRINPKLDCAKLTASQIPSALSLAALAEEGPAVVLKKNNPLSIEQLHGLKYILDQASVSAMVFADSCFPFDQFVARFNKGDKYEKARASREVFIKLKKEYEKTKLEATYSCIECLNKELQEDFGISADIQKITEALKEQNFDRFLHKILLGSCAYFIKFRSPNYRLWPEAKTKEPIEIDATILKIKELLNQKMAVGMDVCPYETPKGNTQSCRGGSHCLVVTGYQKVCKSNGDCRELFQVQNSWGLDWQRENNNGWIDAETLLNHSDVGRSSQILSILNL